MDIDMGMARIPMRVGRLCLPVYGMKTDLHVKHKYFGCRVIAIAIAIAIATNKIKITFDLLCCIYCFLLCLFFVGHGHGSRARLTLYYI
jgi:hypothetical protein